MTDKAIEAALATAFEKPKCSPRGLRDGIILEQTLFGCRSE